MLVIAKSLDLRDCDTFWIVTASGDDRRTRFSVPPGAEGIRAAGASLEYGLECAWQVFRNLKDNNLQRGPGIVIRNAEKMPTLPFLEQPDGYGWQDSQMMSDLR
jgi:hypothetical protein